MLRRTDRLRRACRRGRAQAHRGPFAGIRPTASKNAAGLALAAEQLERVLDDRRRGSARRLEPDGRRGDREARAARNRQSPAAACWPATLEVVGEPRPVGDQKNHLQLRLRQGDSVSRRSPGTWPRKGRRLAAGSRCSIVFHPSINEWQQPPGGPARDQGFRARCRWTDELTATVRGGSHGIERRVSVDHFDCRKAIRATSGCADESGLAAEQCVLDARDCRRRRKRHLSDIRADVFKEGLPGRDHSAAEEDDVRVDRMHEANGPDGQVMGRLAHQALAPARRRPPPASESPGWSIRRGASVAARWACDRPRALRCARSTRAVADA